MAVAQVIGRAQQVERTAMLGGVRDAQQRLRRRDHPQQAAVERQQHIAAAQQGAARQEDADAPPFAVDAVETALLALVPVERDGGGTLDQHLSQSRALGNAFGGLQHGQNRK
jgi:hypothetical protein